MKLAQKTVTPTLFSPIDWKDSFFSKMVVLTTYQPFDCSFRISKIIRITDYEIALEIIPDLDVEIDDFLLVLQGCFQKGSNFREVLQEYIDGESSCAVTQFEFNLNGIPVAFNKKWTAWDCKLQFLRKSLYEGHKWLD